METLTYGCGGPNRMGLQQTELLLLASGLIFVALACSQAQPDPSPGGASPTPTSVESAMPSPVPLAADAGVEPPTSLLYTPTAPPPKLDTSIASVALDEIVFDTFRGGYIRLPRATEEVVESLRDAIIPIYEPKYDPVEAGDWLDDDEFVIGYSHQGGAFAYPVKILNFHEIVNDYIDGVPVLVSYCPLCASGVVFDRELDGRVLLFGNTSALYESDLVMYDHQTGSYWFQVMGEAIVGSLAGKRLKMLPSVTVPWGKWKRLHPDTRVLSRNQGLSGGSVENVYEGDQFIGLSQQVNRGMFSFPVTREKLDGRLRPGDMVFTIRVGESHKAYALTEASDWLLNDVVGDEMVAVIGRAKGPTAVAYLSRANGLVLSFKLDDDTMVDVETGSEWDDAGRAVSGPMAGAQLTAVPSLTSFWFSLVGGLPGIELYNPEQ